MVNWDSGLGPGGTALPGQPLTRLEQAPDQCPLTKIRLISLEPLRTDTTI